MPPTQGTSIVDPLARKHASYPRPLQPQIPFQSRYSLASYQQARSTCIKRRAEPRHISGRRKAGVWDAKSSEAVLPRVERSGAELLNYTS